MKIITILTVLIMFSCSIKGEKEISSRILIKDSGRGVISGITTPTVDYKLEKDGEEFYSITDYPLVDKGGYYTIDITLINQGTYKFTEFNIKDNGEIIYIVDESHQNYINGFSPSAEVNLYLLSVLDQDFDPITITEEDLSITLNESGSIGYIDQTFKVSSNVPNATFSIYMYSIYWKLGATLQSGEIFDMDTCSKFNITDEGDGVPWGKGSVKIVTTNLLGEEVFITGESVDWDKKHIQLIF